MATVRSTPATLTYTLKARGDETNIAWFGGVQRRKGVSAAPWNKRRIFARSFIVPRFGRAFVRTSKGRLVIDHDRLCSQARGAPPAPRM